MGTVSLFTFLFKYASVSAAIAVGLYAGLIGLLTIPYFQGHVVYLHKIQTTWFKDLNVPETFGFLRNQVTPFFIDSPSGGKLYAWHVLPTELYRYNEAALLSEPSGFASNFIKKHAFKLLHDDPNALLVIHMHGAAGTVGSGYRVPNYRALSAGKPDKIHVLAFDYGGFGRSRGQPTERSICQDAAAVVE